MVSPKGNARILECELEGGVRLVFPHVSNVLGHLVSFLSSEGDHVTVHALITWLIM